MISTAMQRCLTYMRSLEPAGAHLWPIGQVGISHATAERCVKMGLAFMRARPDGHVEYRLTDVGRAKIEVPVRRFERGASGMGMDGFLNNAGWTVVTRGGGWYMVNRTGQPGKPKRMLRAQVMELLDQERIKAGLEPIVVRTK